MTPVGWSACRWVSLLTALVCGIGRAEGFSECVRGQASVALESKVLSYGLPDSDDPNLLPQGVLTLFDLLSVGSKFYVDLTNIGTHMGRGDRRWDFWEIDFPTDVSYVFSADDVTWLPTSVGVGAGYRYEYHPVRTDIDDTQFAVADVSLPDLWLVPRLFYERDFVRDDGTYLNLCLGHEFSVLANVDFTVSVAQGLGDEKRVKAYLPASDLKHRLEKAGLMDTMFRLGIVWRITEGLVLSGFVAYSDFLFDRKIRDAARDYIRQSDGETRTSSWTFPCGIAVAWNF